MRTSKSKALTVYGRLAIARSCLIARLAAIVRRPRSTHRAKGKLSHRTSSLAFTANRRSHSVLERSDCWRRSVAEPEWRGFSASTSPDFSPGFSGAAFIGVNCRGSRRKSASRSIGRSTSFSRKISCSISINAHWHIRRPRPARRRGTASSSQFRIRSTIVLQRKESSHGTTNGYGSFADRRSSEAHRRSSTHNELEALGAVLVGAAMGHCARRLFAVRKLLGLFPARSRAEPRVSLGRRRIARHH